MVLHLLLGQNAPVLGASGAISGVVLAFAMLFPDAKVMLLIPPIPMKAKHMVLLFLGIDLFMGFTSVNSGIAHFAHLGGALFGFLLILLWRKFPFNL
jgi:membrane associated rhomboid family serine protease